VSMAKKTATPERTADEQALVDAWQSRPRVEQSPQFTEGDAPSTVVPDTDDTALWYARLAKAMGLRNEQMMEALMNQATNCLGGGPAQAPNVAVASIQSIGPRDGVEAMLAVQMTATHAVAMQMLQRAAREQPSCEVYDSIVNRAVKLLRTYTAQLEALKRYRSAGEQRVVVQHQHVNVTADQAAVQVNGGADPAPGGRGAGSKPEDRSHGPRESQAVAFEPEPAMRCPEPARDIVPVAGGEGAGPLSVSRRR
jgi:proteasome lid subunit RPN8/RPN11